MHTKRTTAARGTNVLIAAALIAPLIFVVGMYVHARRTEQSRQATVDGVLRDYAAVAAWQFARHFGDAMHQSVMRALEVGGDMANRGPAHRHGDVPADSMQRRFRYDVLLRSFEWEGDVPDSAYQDALAKRLDLEVGRSGNEPHRVLLQPTGGDVRFVGVLIDGVRLISGAESDPRSLVANAASRVLNIADLLPRSLVKAPFDTSRMFVRLAYNGSTIFENSEPGSLELAASDTVDAAWGGLSVTVALKPAIAADLLIVSSPGSTTPQFIVFLVLSLALAAAALVQLRRLRELALLRERFVANVSHELRTPLAHISMFAETLALGRERSAQERHQFAQIMLRECRRLSTLVGSVLRFSRQGTAGPAVEPEPRRLIDELNEIIEMFAPISQRADMSIRLEGDATLQAMIDPGAFRQIVLNLLDNAVKFAPAGTLVALKVMEAGDTCIVRVEDSGPGIPAAERDRAFAPFTRLANASGVGGTGIGLAVVRQLADAHGGRAWIESGRSGGAAVCVSFPIVRERLQSDAISHATARLA